MSSTPTISDALAKCKDLEATLEILAKAGMTPYGPAVVDSITWQSGIYAGMEVPPCVVVFRPTAGGDALTLSLWSKPAELLKGAIFTFQYAKGTGPHGTDVLTDLVSTAISFIGFLVSAPPAGSSPPFPYIFAPAAGGALLTLKLGALLSIALGGPYKFSYIPASVSGLAVDEIVGTITPVTG